MRSNQKVKRTAVPTEDPDDTGVELNRITNSTQNNIVREGEAQKLKDGTDNELPPKLNLTDDVKKFVANNLEKNTKKVC